MRLSEAIQWELRKRAKGRKPQDLKAWCDQHLLSRSTVYKSKSPALIEKVAGLLGLDPETLKRRVK